MTAPDYLADSSCALVPGVLPWGPGWYLIAANCRVEAGPFPDEDTARLAADWLDDQGMGVHPAWEPTEDEPLVAPYRPAYSAVGLIVGSRKRDRAGEKSRKVLVLAP